MAVRDLVTRRRLMIAGGAVAAAGALDAFAIEPSWLETRRMQHPIEGLPKELEGFTIAQITDAHIDDLGGVESDILTEIQRASPQLVVLTGDLIDSLEHARHSPICARSSAVPEPASWPPTGTGSTGGTSFVDMPHRDTHFDLCLAGHTHGGQITAAGLAPVTPPGSGRYVAGWYETDLGPMYVSRGTGTSIVPARFCCRPELPLFELTSA